MTRPRHDVAGRSPGNYEQREIKASWFRFVNALEWCLSRHENMKPDKRVRSIVHGVVFRYHGDGVHFISCDRHPCPGKLVSRPPSCCGRK